MMNFHEHYPISAAYNINAVDAKGCSPLFSALCQANTAQERQRISFLLENNAVIKNGKITPPSQIPKLLTRYANAANLHRIFKTCHPYFGSFPDKGIIVEVGSGDGYLKYLLSLSEDTRIKAVRERIAETEISEHIVRNHALNGKFMINRGIGDLVSHFGKAFTPCVVSMNVADIFSQKDLIRAMTDISDLLTDAGIFLHIMTSAIHPHVFCDIRDRHPGHAFLPFCQDGHIGLRVIPHSMTLPGEIGSPTSDAEELSRLFAQNPQGFVTYADHITKVLTRRQENTPTVLFKAFSATKIRQALETTGFECLWLDELTSGIQVRRNRYHEQFPGVNFFNNILGTLVTEMLPSKEAIPPDTVIERATAIVIMARKKGHSTQQPVKGHPVTFTAFGRGNVPGVLTGAVNAHGQWEIAFNHEKITQQFETDYDFQRETRRTPVVYLDSERIRT